MPDLPKWPEGDPAAAFLQRLGQLEVDEAIYMATVHLARSHNPSVQAVGLSLRDSLEAGALGRWAQGIGAVRRGGMAPAGALAIGSRDALLRRLAHDLCGDAAAPAAAGVEVRAEIDRRRRTGVGSARVCAAGADLTLDLLVRGAENGRWTIPTAGQIAKIIARDQ